MSFSRAMRIVVALAVVLTGVWFLARSTGLTPESLSRMAAVQQALAPAGAGSNNAGSAGDSADDGNEFVIIRGEPVNPAVVDISTVPSRPAEVDYLQERYLAGEVDLGINEGPVSEAIYQNMVAESLNQGVDPTIQNAEGSNNLLGTLVGGTNFKSIDYTQSQQGVPPDPDIMVGKDHIVVGVNTSFQVFNKSGASLVGPTLYEDFWGANCGSGSNVVMFDPYSGYDEENGRYVLGITAYDPAINGGNNGWACIAVSQTDSATGSWWLYSFDGNPGTGTDYFFDYPHLGIGQNALYLGANMFGASFVRNHIFAFEKDAMYAGQAANSVKINIGTANFTLQPAKLKGYLTGGWPTNANEPHYFIDAKYGNNQNTLTVWAFSNPWSSPSLTQAGTVTVNTYSLPVSQPQLGGSNIQANDDRLLDVEYWGGRLWTTHTIGCNPGSGTVNCIRWYEINISSGSPSLVQQGTFASNSTYRSFPDLGVNACGDMLVGYTTTSTSMYPSVYVAGREVGDAAGTLKSETLLKAGESFYTAYDSVPRRWGDYTGMALDPDGTTFWYLGEYSRPQTTARWSTWVGSYTWSACNVGPTPTPGPTATPSNTPPPTNTPLPTNTPGPVTCTEYNSADTPIALPNGVSSITSNISVPTGGSISDVNVSVDMPHVWVGDLRFAVSHSSTAVTIIDRPGVPASTYGCSGDNILATIDDAAALSVEDQCAGSTPTINGTFSGNNALSAFNGSDAAGTWTLTVYDDYPSADAGTLNGWSVEVCVEGAGPTATPTSPPPTATNTPLPTATNTPGPTATNTPLPTATNTPPPAGDDVIYIGSTTNGTVGGVAFNDEDILALDTGSGVWSLYIDGSDVGLNSSSNQDIDAFFVMSDGSVLFSIVGDTTISPLGTVDDSDIIRFVPTSTGSTTAGTFEWYFDGSDVGLTTTAEDVDAVHLMANGTILVSTGGNVTVTGVSGTDEDLLVFTPTSLGSTTAGTWALYFDGSDVSLGSSSNGDITGVSVDSATGDIYLNVLGSITVGGFSVDDDDIFICSPGSLGTTTTCTYTFYWNGGNFGFGGEAADGISLQ